MSQADVQSITHTARLVNLSKHKGRKPQCQANSVHTFGWNPNDENVAFAERPSTEANCEDSRR